MRVLLSFLQSARPHPIAPYTFWEQYIKRGIEEVGWTCVDIPDVDWAEGLRWPNGPELDAWLERTWERTVSFARELQQDGGVDVFLSYLFPQQIDASAIRAVQALGIPCVNFYCDNVRDFRSVPEQFRPFDLHWVPEHEAMSMYADAAMPAFSAPMPCWIAPEMREWDGAELHGPTFVGSRDSQREVLFADALARGARVELRGLGWAAGTSTPAADRPRASLMTVLDRQLRFVRDEGPVAWTRKVRAGRRRPQPDSIFRDAVRASPSAHDYLRVLQQSQVAIGVNRYPSFRHPFTRPGTYSRLRDIEAPMAGACYLTEWCDGIDQMYDVGDEIEVYRTADELVAKLDELGNDPEKRHRMRRQAQRRALSSHSVATSLHRMGHELGIVRSARGSR